MLGFLKERVRVILLDRLHPITYPGVLWRHLDKEGETIADIGCGKGGVIEFLRRRGLDSTIVGGDIYKSYLLICKKKKLYSDCILYDARCLPFKEESFDLVMMIGVIEHLKKEDGLALLTQLDKLAKKQIVVFTTVEYLPQEKFNGNVYQEHLSGWHPEEFRKRGYRVYGVSRYPVFEGSGWALT